MDLMTDVYFGSFSIVAPAWEAKEKTVKQREKQATRTKTGSRPAKPGHERVIQTLPPVSL